MNENIMKTGTTTVGIVSKEGLVLAADKRATAGYLIAQKDTEKILQVSNNIAITMAGTASDGQMLIRLLKAEIKLKSLRNGIEQSVPEVANLLSRMVYSNIRKPSMVPGVSHFILGGIDENGYHLYDIFPDGTISLCPKYISSGSGSVMAYGVLETTYKENMSLKDAKELALKCVNAAISRDIASGNGIDIFTITKEGVKLNTRKEIDYKMSL